MLSEFDKNGRMYMREREKKRDFERRSGSIKDEKHVTKIVLTMKTYGTLEHVTRKVHKLKDELALQGIDVDISEVYTKLDEE